ncbi:MAG TPA: hypothetical protein ENI06_01800 [Spirochaetales bacterium]|nr:hypothetical protein [Spirochaetales bacterium]
MRSSFFLLLCVLFFCFALQAGQALELAEIVGMELEKAYKDFGTPVEVFPVRGEEEWQDDVVFYYDSHFYLFWFENRVWQVRVDNRYPGEFLKLKMGNSEAEVIAGLGVPFKREGNSLFYNLQDRAYPLRLRLSFDNGFLVDAYCYRSDF